MSPVPGTAANPFGLLFDFLRGAKCGKPLELMDAALLDGEPGAALVEEFYAQRTVNRQTRRSMTTFNAAN